MYAKSRLAPKNERTIPELELAAVAEAVKHVPSIRQHYPERDLKIVIWSDSSITLSRLRNDMNKYPPFVGNRLLQIHRTRKQYPMQFRYMPTQLNPADSYSRSKTIRQFFDRYHDLTNSSAISSSKKTCKGKEPSIGDRSYRRRSNRLANRSRSTSAVHDVRHEVVRDIFLHNANSRFCFAPIILMTDLKKAFSQIQVHPEERDLLRTAEADNT